MGNLIDWMQVWAAIVQCLEVEWRDDNRYYFISWWIATPEKHLSLNMQVFMLQHHISFFLAVAVMLKLTIVYYLTSFKYICTKLFFNFSQWFAVDYNKASSTLVLTIQKFTIDVTATSTSLQWNKTQNWTWVMSCHSYFQNYSHRSLPLKLCQCNYLGIIPQILLLL